MRLRSRENWLQRENYKILLHPSIFYPPPLEGFISKDSFLVDDYNIVDKLMSYGSIFL